MSFFEAKLVLPSLRSVIRTILQHLYHLVVFHLPTLVLQHLFELLPKCGILLFTVLGTLPGQLFLDTLLNTCLSEPCLGALPGNRFLGTFSWEPVLGNFACLLQTSSWGPCSATCFLQLCFGTWFRNLSFGTLLGILFLLPTLLADVLRNFALQVVLGKLFLGTRATWNHAWERVRGNRAGNLLLGTFLENLFLEPEPVLGNLFFEPLLGNLFLRSLLAKQTCPWEPCLGTCSWKPCLGTCSQGPCLVTLLITLQGNLFLEPFLGNLRHCSWSPCLWTCSCEPCLGTWSCEPCLETCSQEPCLEPPACEPILGNLFCNLFLETCSWVPALGTCFWEPCLAAVSGTLAWEPCLGTRSWEPGLKNRSW